MSTIFKHATKRAWQWHWLAMCALLCLAAPSARAQGTFNSGSTGADGAFAPTVNQMVQLPESGFGGASEAVYVTQSGRRVKLE